MAVTRSSRCRCVGPASPPWPAGTQQPRRLPRGAVRPFPRWTPAWDSLLPGRAPRLFLLGLCSRQPSRGAAGWPASTFWGPSGCPASPRPLPCPVTALTGCTAELGCHCWCRPAGRLQPCLLGCALCTPVCTCSDEGLRTFMPPPPPCTGLTIPVLSLCWSLLGTDRWLRNGSRGGGAGAIRGADGSREQEHRTDGREGHAAGGPCWALDRARIRSKAAEEHVGSSHLKSGCEVLGWGSEGVGREGWGAWKRPEGMLTLKAWNGKLTSVGGGWSLGIHGVV